MALRRLASVYIINDAKDNSITFRQENPQGEIHQRRPDPSPLWISVEYLS